MGKDVEHDLDDLAGRFGQNPRRPAILHRHAVEDVGRLHCPLLVADHDELRFLTELGQQVEEAVEDKFAFLEYLPVERTSALTGRRVDKLLPMVDRIYQNYSQSLPTSVLNQEIEFLTRRVSIPAVRGKHMKIRYITQTGTAPPILTAFTNSRYPPPRNYSRYLKNALRKRFELTGSPLILKFRKD